MTNLKQQAQTIDDSIESISNAIKEYVEVFKANKDPDAENWLKKRHAEFNK